MPTYVSLIHWTDQGIRNYKDTTSRAEDFTKLVENKGGRVRELLWTVGEYDLVAVADFPDDETGTAALLQVGSLGSIRSNTMRAFSADEMTSIIGKTG
ncbi:GYD domain-containing protein [Trebonia kvetii]|uniref:GYD domain-containing protein n=1 Tax=Trebonia kvetii TaxID=2480626 RepID=A0A6P2C5V7_9ACTN|nr:GYD domain-containing protein [Trebonia kvetii]TVZ06387.1 GYD domain-containing protein [Trebonia kvetii]